uniref:Alpha/beta hydrolase fold-3-like protein n=1 Tax=Nigella sativa TaxID=555479 RepID=A0A7D5Q1F6_NIGSA|nr:alpha/beta hydrolase fold-3-like protein [Nigella sativa]
MVIDSTKNLWFRLFVPINVPKDTKLPVLVFFHGGGFTYFSPDLKEYDSLGRRFALEAQTIVVSVNYRLAPESKYPAQYEDGFDTLKYLDTMKDLPENADLKRCFVAGDSAGGNIAHHVACKFARKEHQFHDLNVIGLISMQPFFGGEERTESEMRLKDVPFVAIDKTDWHWKAFLPEGENRDHEAANVFGPKSVGVSHLEDFPPTLVFVGGFDPLQDWQKLYYEGLKKSGKDVRLIEYPDTIHAFYVFPDLPQSSLLMAEVAEFLRSNDGIKS